MAMIEIRNRWTGKTIVEVEAETVSEAVTKLCREAFEKRANLTDASLTDANLTRADLTRADLTDADLTDANLTRANLTDANLTRADLTDANLTDANLTDANLTRANLTGANLTRANLTGAGGLLAIAAARADVNAVLEKAPEQASAVLGALRAGRVDGLKYYGECACLLGTVANARGCDADEIPDLPRDSSRPAEVWFMRIRPGHTPDWCPYAALAAQWIEEWIAAHPKTTSV
jgi:hypothetical protein